MKQVAIIVIVVIMVLIVVVTDQVHTTETDPLQRPANVKCVFHAKKTVSCTYEVPNNTEHNSYTCYVGPCFSHDWNPNNTTCTDPVLRQKLQNTTIPRQCNFDCHPPNAADRCLENVFIVIIRGRQPNKEEVSYCSSFILKQIEKPGPVGNLKEVKTGLSFIKLNWTKPDPDDKDGYNYTLKISGGPKGFRELQIQNKKSNHVKKKIKGLSAWTSYNITVTADRAYPGDPTTINVRTKEGVPLSSPVIPIGSFSVINSTTLMLYPKSIPKEDQQGEIIRYETMTNNYTSFYSLLVERENGGGGSVSLRAATKKGLSGHPTNFTVSRRDLETQSIGYVSLEDGILKWKVLRAEKNFRVYYCSGKMKKNVAICQDEIQHQDVASRMQIKVEELDCDSDCLYAVSARGHSSAGMVWSSALRTVVSVVEADDSGTVTTVVVLFVALTVAIVLGGCCYFMKKKGVCSNYVIHLPEFKHHLLDNKFDTKEDVTTPKLKPLRDSGNASMDTDPSLAAVTDKGTVRQREMSGISNPSDPTIKCDADHPEIHEESSEARRESSHNPGKASAGGLHPSAGGLHPSTGGLHPSTGGAHPSTGGAHPSKGGLHPSAGGLHPSTGGLHPSTGGAHPSKEGSQQIPGTSAEDVTEESLWDNSGQSCVSEYRQFAAIGDGSVLDSSKEEHDDSSGKYCDEQTIDHCLPLSGSVSSVASSCSQSGPSASSYSAVLIPLDSSCKESRQEFSGQESSSQESRQDSSSQESSRPLICITKPKSRHFTKKSLQYS